MKKLAVVLVLVGFVAFCVVKLSGRTVSERFHYANSSVSSQVTFGSPHSPHIRSKIRLPDPPVASAPTKALDAPTTTEADRFSTFALDVDTGSYTLARRLLNEGFLPSNVRVEEFVNALEYQGDGLQTDGAFEVGFEASPSPWASEPNTRILRVTMRARELEHRPPVHLTFLVDVSGSMQSPDRLPLAMHAIRSATSRLRATDTVSIVTYAGRVEVALAPVRARQTTQIEAALKGLHAQGGTAMGSGMKLAYEVALRTHQPGHASRVMVMSDGDANIGATNHVEMLTQVRDYVEAGIKLSTFGFGVGNYQDDMMERLADVGDGNYQYFDGEAEVALAFGDRFDSLVFVAAEEVKAQVEFDPELVESWRQVGYENRQIADEDFRNDAVDAGEVGPGRVVTALYEVTLREGLWNSIMVQNRSDFATFRIRYLKPSGGAEEIAYTLREKDVRSTISEASTDHRAALASAMFARRLTGASKLPFRDIEAMAKSSQNDHSDRADLLAMIQRAGELQSPPKHSVVF